MKRTHTHTQLLSTEQEAIQKHRWCDDKIKVDSFSPSMKEVESKNINSYFYQFLRLLKAKGFYINKAPDFQKMSAVKPLEIASSSGVTQPRWKQWRNHLWKRLKWRKPRTVCRWVVQNNPDFFNAFYWEPKHAFPQKLMTVIFKAKQWGRSPTLARLTSQWSQMTSQPPEGIPGWARAGLWAV